LPGIAALFFALALLAGCADPVKNETSDSPPQDSYPYAFENKSSHELYVIPNPDFPNQGWTSFYLQPDEIKTVYIIRSEFITTIHYAYGPASTAGLVEVQHLDGYWIRFIDKDSVSQNTLFEGGQFQAEEGLPR
jgi:hypothetical protein